MSTVYVNKVLIDKNMIGGSTEVVNANLNNVPFLNNDASFTFSGCVNVTSVSNLSNTVTNVAGICKDCISLTSAPTIPSSVQDTFAQITSLNYYSYVFNVPYDDGSGYMDPINGVYSSKLPPALMSDLYIAHPWEGNIYFEPAEYMLYGATIENIQSNSFVINAQMYNMETHEPETRYFLATRDPANDTHQDLDEYSYINAGMFTNCTSLVTPPTIQNGPTSLKCAFQNCTSLTSIPTIPASVNNIDYAFQNCSSVTSVTLPSTIESGEYAFSGTNITTVPNIPNGITSIRYMFSGCNKITSLPTSFGNTVQDMSYAFSSCNGLTTLGSKTLPNSVTNLTRTFSGCNNLTNAQGLVIPKSVTELSGTFSSCNKLTKFPTIPNSVTSLSSTFSWCNASFNLRSYTIPNSVTSMYGTFDDCRNMYGAPSIPDSVTDMSSCFEWCRSLESIPRLPVNVRTLAWCFQWCQSLKSVPNIGSKCESLSSTFYGCANLTGNIYIESADVISASSVFKNANATKNVYIPFGNTSTYKSFINEGFSSTERINGTLLYEHPNYASSSDGEFYVYKPANKIVGYTGNSANVTVPNSITVSGTTVSITNIGKTVFARNNDIVNVDLNGLNSDVGSVWFNSCANIKSVTNIGSDVDNLSFYSCPNLEDAIPLPDTVTNMYTSYGYCYNLTNAGTLPNNVSQLWQTFVYCNSLVTAPVIPASVTNMGYTFRNCTNLTGNIIIESENITQANWCFLDTELEKDVYIPLQNNGVNTATYNAFTTAGYSIEERVEGVLLKDIADAPTPPGPEPKQKTIDTEGFIYTTDENDVVVLTGLDMVDKTSVTLPNID